jgi:hypothetical protein
MPSFPVSRTVTPQISGSAFPESDPQPPRTVIPPRIRTMCLSRKLTRLPRWHGKGGEWMPGPAAKAEPQTGFAPFRSQAAGARTTSRRGW